jgi:prepilin-type N-terminal cleavage/methylation domain-containing protein
MLKQRGYTLIEISIVLVVMVYISGIVFKEIRQNIAESRASQQAERIVETFMKASERYQVQAKSNNIVSPTNFPSSIQVLVNEGYFKDCSPADSSAGNCRPITETLWGDTISARAYGVNGNLTIPRFELTVPLAKAPPSQRDTIAAELLAKVPFATVSGTNIVAEIGRPGTEIAHDGFYMLDGSRPLKGNMNAAGFAIENVKDISMNGLANRTVLSGLAFNNVQQNNQPVSLVTCPPGRGNLKVTVIPLSYSKDGRPFTKAGAVEGRFEGGRAYVRIWETVSDTNQGWFIPQPAAASVAVLQQCSK